jgi:uncharacterized damage-inducible protein DinB
MRGVHRLHISGFVTPLPPLLEFTVRRSMSALALPLTFVALSGLVALPARVSAQGLMAEMHTEVGGVQKKLVDLAKAMPESAFAWRPAAGVRSVGEVFKHVASDNYLLPIMMGAPAPASSGISATDMKTVQAYEMRPMTKAQIVAELEASFNHLHGAMRLTTDANLTETIKFFGSDWTRQKAMLLTVTHLHEHLGQSIAYARSNGVVPPWSK